MRTPRPDDTEFSILGHQLQTIDNMTSFFRDIKPANLPTLRVPARRRLATFLKIRLASRFAVAGLLASLMANSLKAQSTFDYTGVQFTQIDNAVLGTSLDASVTFENTIPSDFTGTVDYTQVQAFTLEGVNSSVLIASSDSSVTPIDETFTFDDGQIVDWDLRAQSTQLGGIVAETQLSTGRGVSYPGDTINTYHNDGQLSDAQNLNFTQAGTWVAASVPEPSYLGLAACALGTLVVLRRRRFRDPYHSASRSS
jgi:hypothetical protein